MRGREAGRGLPEGQLVDEVHGHGPLADPHLLALHVGHVVVPDHRDLPLQPAGDLVLLPVLLTLQPGSRLLRERGAGRR